MRIVHVVEAWKGGVASYVEALIKDQIQKGYSVFLVADKEQVILDCRDLGVDLIEYRSSRNPLRFLFIARDLFEKINRVCPDVIHCHSTFPGIYIRLFRYPCKVVYTPHAWSFFKSDVSLFLRWFFKGVELFLSRRSNRIICMSLEEIRAAIKLGISSDKISLVYTGIPDLTGDLVYQDLAGADSTTLKVGFFGRFDYQKGFDLVVAALQRVNNNVEIHIFGGFVRGAEFSLDSRFINHGWIAHQDIHKYMSLMDVILIPSRWEGFALTPLEAMRAGRPVIVSSFSSLPEVVIDGFNGIVLAEYSADGLARVLNSLLRNECRRMGVNARIVYEQNFTFNKFSGLIDKAYIE